jgi:hypothetical protein
MPYPTAESIEIAASPDTVWAMVSDLPRMGQWSPENEGGRWLKGATGPATGATFKGKNKNGIRRWSTTATVVDCQPGKVFEIAVTFGPLAVANWRYEIEATTGGCKVTESWNDHRAAWMKVVSSPMGDHSGDHARTEMVATLSKLASAAAPA